MTMGYIVATSTCETRLSAAATKSRKSLKLTQKMEKNAMTCNLSFNDVQSAVYDDREREE